MDVWETRSGTAPSIHFPTAPDPDSGELTAIGSADLGATNGGETNPYGRLHSYGGMLDSATEE